jgi:DNA-binding NtrC family response regulator
MATPLDELRGASRPMVGLRTEVVRLLAHQQGARRLPPVLILGETGTGKGLLARCIHQAGPRREGPFVAVNCAAIPETLLEAELFGYERGAFTDARQAKPGLFQTAHSGTLFLDEIGLLPGAVQGKLLTVLEDRAVRRLGGTRTESVDVAVVAATSVDLKRALGEGRFREDLYHRLAVIMLTLPPLRERGGDMLALAEHFLERACADYGLSARSLPPEVGARLMAYRWPGNVRELANAMERVALLSESDAIPATLLDFLPSEAPGEAQDPGQASTGSLDDALRARIEVALRETGGNIRRTADALGISRNTLRTRMDRYGLRQRARAPVPVSGAAPPSPIAESGPVQWERRHLAFLRVRVRASSADTRRALDVFGEKITSFGGRIEEWSPTGLAAVFGLEPVDNPSSHAALAALAIQNAATRARAAGGESADVVVALHCADHLVGRRASAAQLAVDGKVATWSVLEDLVAIDSPGAVVVTEAVASFLARRFALQPLQDPERRALRLLNREGAPAAANLVPFVGRALELDTLRQAAARAEQHRGQVVGIAGDAGLGKSRLLHEATRQLRGWRVLQSAGAPYARTASYVPIVELLKRYCYVEDTDTASAVQAKVTAALSHGVGDPGEATPPVLDLLAALPADDPFRQLEPAERRRRTLDAMKRLILAASATVPLCLIVEDLHWIDPETEAVLDCLVESIAASRVLLLVNYRPEYRNRWSSKTYYRQLQLEPLSGESAEQFLRALLGEDPAVQPLAAHLTERTEGNPFFLEESVRSLVEAGVLGGQRGTYRLTRTPPRVEIPSTVQALLSARIDRLPAEEKHILEMAAVIGKRFPLRLLQAISDQEPEALRRRLAALQAAEFIYETAVVPDVEYTFKHALTHEVAYEGMLDARRRALHAAVMDAMGNSTASASTTTWSASPIMRCRVSCGTRRWRGAAEPRRGRRAARRTRQPPHTSTRRSRRSVIWRAPGRPSNRRSTSGSSCASCWCRSASNGATWTASRRRCRSPRRSAIRGGSGASTAASRRRTGSSATPGEAWGTGRRRSRPPRRSTIRSCACGATSSWAPPITRWGTIAAACARARRASGCWTRSWRASASGCFPCTRARGSRSAWRTSGTFRAPSRWRTRPRTWPAPTGGPSRWSLLAPHWARRATSAGTSRTPSSISNAGSRCAGKPASVSGSRS